MSLIIERFKEIDFHDLPVAEITFKFDPKFECQIIFEIYDEELHIYHKKELIFSDVEKFKIDNFLPEAAADVEIFSFDYIFDKTFTCKIILPLGFRKPNAEISMECHSIALRDI